MQPSINTLSVLICIFIHSATCQPNNDICLFFRTVWSIWVCDLNIYFLYYETRFIVRIFIWKSKRLFAISNTCIFYFLFRFRITCERALLSDVTNLCVLICSVFPWCPRNPTHCCQVDDRISVMSDFSPNFAVFMSKSGFSGRPRGLYPI